MSVFPASPLIHSHQHAHAVIDIGSNSVRMVVYHAPVRVPLPLYNEKYYCGLGSGLAATGKLSPEGVKKAQAAIARFVVMANRLGVNAMTVLATAAIRDARDGEAFVRMISKKYQIEVQVISGPKEAELAAMGVLGSIHDPVGISADLGGGSIELASLRHDKIAHQSSFELGVLRMADESGGDPVVIGEMIDAELASLEWLPQVRARMIYAIGGSFRTLAKTHMKQTGYPLPILHEYTLSKRTIDKMVKHLMPMGVKDIGELPGIPAKRAATILPAAMMLQRLMERSGANKVMFSVSGIREGLLYSQLPPKQQKQDPLLASALDLASLAGRQGRYAQELFDWMQPLFKEESDRRKRLRMALCCVSEMAWTIDPNFRGEWAYLRILHSAIKGVDHRERVLLALALYHRHHSKWKQDREELALLDERDRLWARCVGMAANLAFQLSGGKQGNLHHARLTLSGKQVKLALDSEAKPLRTDTVEKKLEGLGETFKALSSFVI